MEQSYLKSFYLNEQIKRILISFLSIYTLGIGIYLLMYFPYYTISIILIAVSTPLAIRNTIYFLFSLLHIQNILNFFIFGFSIFTIGLILFLSFIIFNVSSLFIPALTLIIIGISLII